MLPVLTPSDLPADLEAVRTLALEQNRLARTLWEQLEILINRAQFGASSERLPGPATI